MEKIFKNCYFIISILICSILVLQGCSSNLFSSKTSDQLEQLKKVETYVKSINSASSDISAEITSLNKAISEKDTINIKLCAQKISSKLDDVSALEIPDSLKETGEKYKQAALSLKDVINEYSDIFIDSISNASSTISQEQISQLQSKYNDAVTSLKDADSSLSDLYNKKDFLK